MRTGESRTTNTRWTSLMARLSPMSIPSSATVTTKSVQQTQVCAPFFLTAGKKKKHLNFYFFVVGK